MLLNKQCFYYSGYKKWARFDFKKGLKILNLALIIGESMPDFSKSRLKEVSHPVKCCWLNNVSTTAAIENELGFILKKKEKKRKQGFKIRDSALIIRKSMPDFTKSRLKEVSHPVKCCWLNKVKQKWREMRYLEGFQKNNGPIPHGFLLKWSPSLEAIVLAADSLWPPSPKQN